MNPSMIASKYELLVIEHNKALATIAELKFTMSENNEFYSGQLSVLNCNAKLDAELIVQQDGIIEMLKQEIIDILNDVDDAELILKSKNTVVCH